MRLLVRLSCVFALFAIGGCAEVTGPPPNPVEITITSWPVVARLSGVQLCEADNAANCETTNSNGQATLLLPVDEETSFTAERQGYGSYLLPVVIPTEGESYSLFIASAAALESLHEDVTSPYPLEDMGRINCEVPGVEGVTFDLFDDEGPVPAKHYYREPGPPPTWNDELTETTTEGEGGFLEVSRGEYQVQVGGAVGDCVPEVGWPAAPFSPPNSIRLPVRAGYITKIIASCSE